jgi:hypothetical protein
MAVAVGDLLLPHAIATTAVDANVNVMTLRTFPPEHSILTQSGAKKLKRGKGTPQANY